jgi:hypothetical protein
MFGLFGCPSVSPSASSFKQIFFCTGSRYSTEICYPAPPPFFYWIMPVNKLLESVFRISRLFSAKDDYNYQYNVAEIVYVVLSWIITNQVLVLLLKDIWYVSDIFFRKIFQPSFEEFLEIIFPFSIVSILHTVGYDRP